MIDGIHGGLGKHRGDGDIKCAVAETFDIVAYELPDILERCFSQRAFEIGQRFFGRYIKPRLLFHVDASDFRHLCCLLIENSKLLEVLV